MVNCKLSNTLKLMLKMNLPRDIKKMKSSVRNSEWRAMVNCKLSNTLKLMLKMNSLKVLVRTRVLVKPLKLMAMVNKKNTVMPNKLRNSLKDLVRTRVLVKPSESTAMENKKNSVMLKQKTNGFLKMTIFSWLKPLEKKLLSNLLVLKVPLFQTNIDKREEITTQLKEPKT